MPGVRGRAGSAAQGDQRRARGQEGGPSRRPHLHLRRPGGQRRHPRGHRLLGSRLPGHARRPRADRRPLHPEEHARFPPGGPGPGAHHLYHRLRRRRAVLGGGRIRHDGRRLRSRPVPGAPEIPGSGPLGNLDFRVPGAHGGGGGARKTRPASRIWPASTRWRPRLSALHRPGSPGGETPGPHLRLHGLLPAGRGVSPLGVRLRVAAAGKPPQRAGAGGARGSPGSAPDHAGAPQSLLPGVDHPPVRPRSPGGQRSQTPGGPGGAGARGRRGDPAPAGIPPGPGPEPGPQPGLLPDRHLPHGRGDHR